MREAQGDQAAQSERGRGRRGSREREATCIIHLAYHPAHLRSCLAHSIFSLSSTSSSFSRYISLINLGPSLSLVASLSLSSSIEITADHPSLYHLFHYHPFSFVSSVFISISLSLLLPSFALLGSLVLSHLLTLSLAGALLYHYVKNENIM